MGGEAIEELRRRSARHPPDRYPVQHATARLHLGVALAGAGELAEAEESLATAMDLFAGRLPEERAKAANALGAVLRQWGRLQEAAAAFTEAAAGPLSGYDRAAALFNRGLVRSQLGDQGAAADLAEARRIFADAGAPQATTAATRELAAVLAEAGRLDEARDAAAEARVAARRAGDAGGEGLAANLAGLIELAAGRPEEAAGAFRDAAAAHPRRLRPEGYAVARANLALACERAGDALQAGLAAGQALAVPGAPEAARAVAAGVIGRVRPRPGLLAAALGEPGVEAAGIARAELDRWVDLGDEALAVEAEGWVERLAPGGPAAEQRWAVWLGAALELPTPELERLLGAVLAASEGRPGLGAALERAVAHHPGPQYLRLSEAIGRLKPTHGPRAEEA